VAKTRKSVKKSAKRTSGVRKAASGKKKAVRAPARKELDLRPLKKQLKAHMKTLSGATSKDLRVQNAIASLSRLHEELNEECIPTMTIPLE
jgi:hypothetical protein